MKVSIIIPAHNAAATLDETLDSVRAQTHAGWEVVLVDDGSTDATRAIAEAAAAADPRIHVISQPQGGVSAARNTGLRNARSEWVSFLDADDLLYPRYLERLTHALVTGPELDAAFCHTTSLLEGGQTVGRRGPWVSGDLFSLLAGYCALDMHACVVRRSLVESVGGFDESLRTSEDWDLWVRLARAGTRFGCVPEILAAYRLRPTSASAVAHQIFHDLMRVVERVHGPDPRVPASLAVHERGVPAEALPASKLRLACWPAALLIGRGEDPRPLLECLEIDRVASFDPALAGQAVFEGVLRVLSRPAEVWPELWPRLQPLIDDFFVALEARAAVPGLARGARNELERWIAQMASGVAPFTVGGTHARRIEVTEPIGDVVVPDGAERLAAAVEIDGDRLGVVELPVIGGRVRGEVLADAIANEFAWTILGKVFRGSVYPGLEARRQRHRRTVYRGQVRLGDVWDDPAIADWREGLHDAVGWTVFLQELWARPTWPVERFYDAGAPDPQAGARTRIRVRSGPAIVEVGQELPELDVRGREVDVIYTVGGAQVGAVKVPVRKGKVGPQALRAAITTAGGFELARVAIVRGVFGRPLDPARSLAAALREAAEQSRTTASAQGAAVSRAGAPAPELVLGRREPYRSGGVHSRRAALPAAAASELLAMAEALGEPVARGSDARVSDVQESVARGSNVRDPDARDAGADGGGDDVVYADVVYAPDLIVLRGAGARARTLPGVSSFSSRLRKATARILGPVRPRGNGSAWAEQGIVTARLPILVYHRVAPTGSPATAQYRVTPGQFEEHLLYLRRAGYRSATVEEWRRALEQKRPIPGRAVLITFDDGYVDFATHAWPLLKRYGFSAVVFLVADKVGGTNDWDRAFGEELPLLGWDEIRRLQAEGVEFGSHTTTHPRLRTLSHADVVREGARSRAILSRELGRPVSAFAYPYGDHDPVVRHLIGACGYTVAMTTVHGLSGLNDSPLAIPRMNVGGDDGVDELIEKLGPIPIDPIDWRREAES